MKKEFDLLLSKFANDASRSVDSKKDYYQAFVNDVPKSLYKLFDREKYLIKASIGNGNKAEIPWLCIFNREITSSAVQGIYICYLFNADMSGFYLVLLQGITAFKKYKRNQNKCLKKASEYFKNLIEDNYFDKGEIVLNGKKGLSKSYEAGTILSKYYKKDDYIEDELLTDLQCLKNIYDEIADSLSYPYMEIIDNIMNDNYNPTTIQQAFLIENDGMDIATVNDGSENLLKLSIIPKAKKKKRINRKLITGLKKVDYRKKAQRNEETGLLGEMLVLNYERNRLINLGRRDLAEKIEWRSRADDTLGYDIKSFDIDQDHQVHDRFIEVKTTVGDEYEEFYITRREKNIMDEYKDYYYVYRVYNLKTDEPKFYMLSYEDMSDRVELSVYDYVATIKNIE